MYNTQNYTEQGGAKTVIGGTLEILEGANVTGLLNTPAANVAAPAADADAAAVRTALIDLLGALKTAGLMTADDPSAGGE